jgi:hypothetical protein
MSVNVGLRRLLMPNLLGSVGLVITSLNEVGFGENIGLLELLVLKLPRLGCLVG